MLELIQALQQLSGGLLLLCLLHLQFNIIFHYLSAVSNFVAHLRRGEARSAGIGILLESRAADATLTLQIKEFEIYAFLLVLMAHLLRYVRVMSIRGSHSLDHGGDLALPSLTLENLSKRIMVNLG